MIKKTAGIKIILLAGLAAFFIGCSQDAEIVREIIYKRTCDIVYNSNGGTGKMESSYVPEGVKTKLKENEFTKLGYTFAGWLEAPSQEYDEKGEAKYTLYSAGQEVSVKTNVTFYAQWKENVTRKISPESKKTIPYYYNNLIPRTTVDVYFQTIIDEDGNEKVISDIPFIAMEDIPELTESYIFYKEKPEMVKEKNFYSFSYNDELLNFYFDTNQILMTDISTFNKNPDAMPGLDFLSPSYEVSGEKRYFDRMENRTYSVSANPTIINLDNYEVHLLMDSEGNGYVPLQTFIDLAWEYISGAYNGKALYYIGNNDLVKSHFYSEAASEQPSTELMEFNFNETCMVLDCFYGLKKEHSINDFRTYISSLNMKDGSSMLESFLNENPLKPAQALHNLIEAYFDDIHSDYRLPNPYISSDYYEGLDQVKENSIDGTYYNSYRKLRQNVVGKKNNYYKTLDGKRSFSMYEDKEYEDGIVIILTFDGFKIPVYDWYSAGEEKREKCLEQYAREGKLSNMELVACTQYKIKKYIEEGKKVKAVIIDLSCNGGGKIDAGIYMSAWIKYGEESYILTNTLTNAQSVCRYKVDTNFDGKFDSSDSLLGLSPDTKIYCLTSKVSFSCGNYMPASIKGSPNVTLIGQRTGGGACAVGYKTTALGDSYQISSPYNVNTIVNGSAYSVDTGVEPDVYVSNFENLYDRQKLVDLINNLK